MVAVHGGSFTNEISQVQWSIYASFVRDADVEVVIPIYPLAPRGEAKTVVPLIADIIDAQVQIHGPEGVGVEGDSAGGGLAMAAIQELVRRGREVPARMVLISPWLDAAMSDPRSRGIKDPLLSVANLKESGRLWAGGLDPANPRSSPLNGSLAGLPPTVVYAGSLDILYPDSLRLRERVRREGAQFDFDFRPGLMHAWALFRVLPEARSVRRRLVRQLTVSTT